MSAYLLIGQSVFFILALLCTMNAIYDTMTTMMLINRGQEKKAKPIYLWVPAVCWGIFYLLTHYKG